jgi:hypothetical protein
VNKNSVQVPVKKLKNKKIAMKIKRVREFAQNVSTYIETLKFKVSLGMGDNVEDDVNQMLQSQDDKDFIKITPLKVMYIHLRDN